jgi:hypothetical protein
LLLLLTGALFAVCLLRGESTAKLLILGFFMLPVTILFIESTFRRTLVTGDGVVVFKLLRKKELKYAELTAVETVRVRKRVSDPCAGDDFLIISMLRELPRSGPGAAGGVRRSNQRGNKADGSRPAGEEQRCHLLLVGCGPDGIHSLHPAGRTPVSRDFLCRCPF